MELAKREWSQRQLAERAGVTEETISRMIGGHGFTSTTLGKIAAALGVEPAALLSD